MMIMMSIGDQWLVLPGMTVHRWQIGVWLAALAPIQWGRSALLPPMWSAIRTPMLITNCSSLWLLCSCLFCPRMASKWQMFVYGCSHKWQLESEDSWSHTFGMLGLLVGFLAKSLQDGWARDHHRLGVDIVAAMHFFLHVLFLLHWFIMSLWWLMISNLVPKIVILKPLKP